ncbi:MAG: ABC transporter ATP-binding protein, partial [bacterium]
MTTTTMENPIEEMATRPTWWIIWRLIRFRYGIFLLNLAAMIFLMMAAQLPGLVMRAFFDMLTGKQVMGINLWTLVVLIFVGELSEIIGIYGLVRTNVPFFVNTMTLLRKNLLRHILRRPGASALPDSPGEAISRFRGDVFEMPLFALWMNDLIGSIIFCAIALVVMFHINASIT